MHGIKFELDNRLDYYYLCMCDVCVYVVVDTYSKWFLDGIKCFDLNEIK